MKSHIKLISIVIVNDNRTPVFNGLQPVLGEVEVHLLVSVLRYPRLDRSLVVYHVAYDWQQGGLHCLALKGPPVEFYASE